MNSHHPQSSPTPPRTETHRAKLERLEAAAWSSVALTDRQRHLLLIADACAITALDEERVTRHVQGAREEGATDDEIIEVAQLAASLPIHACTEGLPVLARATGQNPEDLEAGFTDEQRISRERFISARGYWSEFWTILLNYDPEFFEAYSEFSSHPWHHGVLEPYFKELVYLAFDASPMHLYRPGMEIHTRNAISRGAEPAQIAAVLALLSVSGSASVDLVTRALSRAGRNPSQP